MSFLTIFTPLLIVIVVLAFILELVDATLGIGFGTAFTPILLIIGYSVFTVVPSILIAELVAGIVAMIFHGVFKNVRLGQKRVFRRRRLRRRKKVYSILDSEIVKSSKSTQTKNLEEKEDCEDDYEEEEDIVIEDENEIEIEEHDEVEEIKLDNGSIRKWIGNLTTDTKVIIILSVMGILASIIAAIINVVLAENEPFNLGVKLYIGVMVFGMGILTLAFRNTKMKFSIKRIFALGTFAGFNKGISGGGYRPVTVAGQILAGREGRRALASSTFSKTAVCFVGILTYIITHVILGRSMGTGTNWDFLYLAPFLIIGKTSAAPIGAFIARKIETKWLKLLIGWGTVFLGVFSLVRITLDHYGIWEIIPKIIIF
jgi:uncharacterized membrane protein YfcA